MFSNNKLQIITLTDYLNTWFRFCDVGASCSATGRVDTERDGDLWEDSGSSVCTELPCRPCAISLWLAVREWLFLWSSRTW